MIELTKVTKIYAGAQKAVDNISFEVKEGEIFGLMWPSAILPTGALKRLI